MHPFRAHRDSLKVDASPSVSLERGGYRMRAPRLNDSVLTIDFGSPPQGEHTSVKRRNPADKMNQRLVVILAILTMACITCFAFAYYLFTSRWDPVSWKESPALANGPNQVIAPQPYKFPQHDGGYFLAYLPHSGFHNQRIALENALSLARLLNRTLLVPPIRFGIKPVRYLPFDKLYRSMELSTSEGLKHCAAIPSFISLPLECLDYFDSTTLPWSELFDVSELGNEQEIIFLNTLSPLIYSNLPQVQGSTTLQIRDQFPYQYRFVDDNLELELQSNKYTDQVSISRLRQAQQRLIQLGTLFGTTRLLLGEENMSMLNSIRARMVVKHPTVKAIADKIVDQLPKRYIGLHLRLGDGRFAERRTEIVQNSWCDLLRRLGYTAIEVEQIEISAGGDGSHPCSSFSPTNSKSERFPFRAVAPNLGCKGHHPNSKFHGLPYSIFVSTDLIHPQSDPLLLPFRRTFPCLYFLSDFRRELNPLQDVQNPIDGVNLYKYLVPFVEAVVAARADLIVGTPGSTFSKFIERTLSPAYRQGTDTHRDFNQTSL